MGYPRTRREDAQRTRGGTALRDPFGYRLPGEYNQNGEPIGASDPMGKERRAKDWEDAFTVPQAVYPSRDVQAYGQMLRSEARPASEVFGRVVNTPVGQQAVVQSVRGARTVAVTPGVEGAMTQRFGADWAARPGESGAQLSARRHGILVADSNRNNPVSNRSTVNVAGDPFTFERGTGGSQVLVGGPSNKAIEERYGIRTMPAGVTSQMAKNDVPSSLNPARPPKPFYAPPAVPPAPAPVASQYTQDEINANPSKYGIVLSGTQPKTVATQESKPNEPFSLYGTVNNIPKKIGGSLSWLTGTSEPNDVEKRMIAEQKSASEKAASVAGTPAQQPASVLPKQQAGVDAFTVPEKKVGGIQTNFSNGNVVTSGGTGTLRVASDKAVLDDEERKRKQGGI